MYPIFADKKFTQGWMENITGTGALFVVGGILKVTGSGNDSAMKEYWIPVSPGQTVQVEILARAVSGDARVAVGAIDYAESVETVLDYVIVDGPEWKRYKLSVDIPYSETKEYVRVNIGKWGSIVSNCEVYYQDPIFKTTDGKGGEIVLATGLLHLNNGSVSINESFRSYGIKSFSFNGVDTVDVVLEHRARTTMRPLMTVSGTPDSFLIPLAGSLATVGSETSFKIKWSNGASIANVASGSYYVVFKVYM